MFRHELKYIINISDYYKIQNTLKNIAKIDTNATDNNSYKIRSLYFDNCYDKARFEKLNGLNNRSKFRIRFYNNNTNFIRLEKKSKVNGLCVKVSELISKEDCSKILLGDTKFLYESNSPLYNDLYVAMKVDLLRPKVIVDYIRQAFIYAPGNVRITLDKNIKTGLASINFLDSAVSTKSVIPDEKMVLEVKWDEYLPEIIQNCIQVSRCVTSLSKYELCRSYI